MSTKKKTINVNALYNRKQKGVVLVVSLVFLLAVTSIAGMLMQNTTTDIKMSGATQDKSIAYQEAVSAVDEVIYNEVNNVAGPNRFSNNTAVFTAAPNNTIEVPVSYVNSTGSIALINNPNGLSTDCSRVANGNSTGPFKCRNFAVQVVQNYGRTNNNAIQVIAGITRVEQAN